MSYKGEIAKRVKPQYQRLFAFVLLHNSGARKMFRYLCRGLDARNITADYLLFRNEQGVQYADDPGAWNCPCKCGLFCALIRHDDGEWLLHS